MTARTSALDCGVNRFQTNRLPPSAASAASSGEIVVSSRRAAIAEIISHMDRQRFPLPDSFAVRILLSEALTVASALAGIDERLTLRFDIRRERVMVRLDFRRPPARETASYRLRRRRRKVFQQLFYLPLFSTSHRIEEQDGSLTILRDSGHRAPITPVCES